MNISPLAPRAGIFYSALLALMAWQAEFCVAASSPGPVTTARKVITLSPPEARKALPAGEPCRPENVGAADPYQLPVRRLSSLLRYSHDDTEVHRVHVRGAVSDALLRSPADIAVIEAAPW